MLSEKAKSRAQQRFFGMVRATQKGEMENPSPEITKVASTVSKSDVKKMASTKHKGLPEKKKVEEAAFLAAAGKAALAGGKGMIKQKAKQVVKQKAANVAKGAIPQPNRDTHSEGVGRAAIGAGIGAMVGGPVGAAVGGSIGAAMGKKKKVTTGGKKVKKKATNFFKAEPKVTSSEGVVSFVKKGLERDKKAKKEKDIKNRKAVPYAALAAEHQPEGEVVSELKTSTLLSYSHNATNDLAFKGDGKKKAQKRATGIKRAASKVALRAVDPDGSMGINKNPKNEEIEVLRNLVSERAAKSGGDVALATGKLVGKTIGTVTGGLVGGLAGGFPGAAVGAVSGNVVGGKLAPGHPEKKTIVNVKKEDWQPEITHSKMGDATKKAAEKKKKEAQKGLPPHLQGDWLAKARKAFKENYRVLARDKGDKGRPAQFSYKDEKLAKKFADSVKSKGGKATVAKEGTYDEPNLEKRKSNNEKARKELKKDAKDSGYTDIALKASMSKGAGVSEGKETAKLAANILRDKQPCAECGSVAHVTGQCPKKDHDIGESVITARRSKKKVSYRGATSSPKRDKDGYIPASHYNKKPAPVGEKHGDKSNRPKRPKPADVRAGKKKNETVRAALNRYKNYEREKAKVYAGDAKRKAAKTGEYSEGVMDIVNRYKKKKEEKKPQKAQDAGARARRVLKRREYTSKVSSIVPAELEDQKVWDKIKKYI